MKLSEKLSALLNGKDRAEVASKCGVTASSLNNYLYRNSEPASSTALKLARALNVPMEWLIDDEQNWPPPSDLPASKTATLSPDDLRLALGEHLRPAAVRLTSVMREAWEVDWMATAQAFVAAAQEGRQLTPDELAVAELPEKLQSLTDDLEAFDPTGKFGADASVYSLLTLAREFHLICKVPGFSEAAQMAWALTFPDKHRSPSHAKTVSVNAEEVLRKLQEIRNASGPPVAALTSVYREMARLDQLRARAALQKASSSQAGTSDHVELTGTTQHNQVNLKPTHPANPPSPTPSSSPTRPTPPAKPRLGKPKA